MSIIRNLIATPTRSGKVCDERQAMKFLMLCRSRGLNPFEGDAFLIGFDGKDGPEFSLVTAHQAFLKRAEMHPQYDGMDSGVVILNKDGTVSERQGDLLLPGEVLFGGWAVVYRKDRTHPTKRIGNLTTFKKGYGRWNSDPAGMIVKCIEADALRSTFPTQMAGMYLAEEQGPKEVVVKTNQPEVGRISFRRGNGQSEQPTIPTMTAPEPTIEPDEPVMAEQEPAEETSSSGPENSISAPAAVDGGDHSTAPDEEEMQKDDECNALAGRIEAATTLKELGGIAGAMERERNRLGEERYERLIRLYQVKYAAASKRK